MTSPNYILYMYMCMCIYHLSYLKYQGNVTVVLVEKYISILTLSLIYNTTYNAILTAWKIAVRAAKNIVWNINLKFMIIFLLQHPLRWRRNLGEVIYCLRLGKLILNASAVLKLKQFSFSLNKLMFRTRVWNIIG